MAITITQEKKKQKYMLLILAVVTFGILVIIWMGFFRKDEASAPAPNVSAYAVPNINIDWQMLDKLSEKPSIPFETIKVFEGSFGRSNPFTPY